jgi:hypothetical protein
MGEEDILVGAALDDLDGEADAAAEHEGRDEFSDICPPPSAVRKKEGVLSSAELDEMMLVKLVSGWSRRTTNTVCALGRKKMPWRAYYQRLTNLVGHAGVRNVPGFKGAIVSGGDAGLEGLFRYTFDWYNARHLFLLPPEATVLPWLLYWDGRTIFSEE